MPGCLANTTSRACFAWNQVLSYPITAQRAFLYGIPLYLLIMTLLWVGLHRNTRRLFVFAAIVTGTLPYSNEGTLLVLPLTLPFLALLFPVRPLGRTIRSWITAYPIGSWLVYGMVSMILALPQVLVQQGTGANGFQPRWLPGWNLSAANDAGHDPWWWYAVKNFGYLLLLIPLGLLLRNTLTSSARRLLLATMPLFPISQLIVFQPLADDNAKLVMQWYLTGALAAAAALAELWRRSRTALPKVILVAVASSLLLTGVLIHVQFIAASGRIRIANAEELSLGEQVRQRTPTDAVFAAGQYHTNAILMLGGRRLLVGWGGQIWTHGLDARPQEAALGQILRYEPEAETDIQRYGVDYVAISYAEIDGYDANLDAYRARYPVIIDDGTYTVFAVSPRAIDRAVADGVQIPETAPRQSSLMTRAPLPLRCLRGGPPVSGYGKHGKRRHMIV